MQGILLAIVAMIGWGIADFLVQRASRRVGVLATLFAISVFGAVALAPFVLLQPFPDIFTQDRAALLALYLGLGVASALFSVEAFRKGKLAVIAPILGFELPVTILLAVGLRGEHLSPSEWAAIAFVFCGILLTVWKRQDGSSKSRIFEKGVLFGALGAMTLGALNFVTGVASQDLSPLFTVWIGRAAFTVVFGGVLAVRGRFPAALSGIHSHGGLLFVLSALYLTAFLCYGVATTLAPISIVTTVSENYIVLAALLGIIVNKERLERHQYAGAAVAVAGVLALAYVSG